MSNGYYNFIDPAEPGTLVDPFAYNREMEAITDAFDVIPPATQLTSGTLNFSTDSGVANAYVANVAFFPLAYEKGCNVALRIANASTGPSTLDVNGLGPKRVIMDVVGDVTAGDLKANGIYTFVYNGTDFQAFEMSTRYYQAALNNATAAANSATAANTSKNTAATQATNATNSATAANTSKNTAATQATNATTSATTASGKATAATTSANAASGSAGTASTRASAATASATTAATGATNATNSNTAATNSKNTAATQATNATNSATSAANSKTAADAILTDPNLNTKLRTALLELELFVGAVEMFASNIDPNTVYPGTTWTRLPASCSIRISNATGSDVLTQVGSDTVTLAAGHLPAHNHGVTPGTVSTTDVGTKTLSTFDYGTDTLATFTDSAKTSSTFDYGSDTLAAYDFAAATTNSTGAHTHGVPYIATGGGTTFTIQASTNATVNYIVTSSAGAHTHTFDMPSHSHTVAVGSHNHTYALNTHTHGVALGAHSHTIVMGSHNHSATMAVNNNGSGGALSVVNLSLILVAWYRSA